MHPTGYYYRIGYRATLIDAVGGDLVRLVRGLRWATVKYDGGGNEMNVRIL